MDKFAKIYARIISESSAPAYNSLTCVCAYSFGDYFDALKPLGVFTSAAQAKAAAEKALDDRFADSGKDWRNGSQIPGLLENIGREGEGYAGDADFYEGFEIVWFDVECSDPAPTFVGGFADEAAGADIKLSVAGADLPSVCEALAEKLVSNDDYNDEAIKKLASALEAAAGEVVANQHEDGSIYQEDFIDIEEAAAQSGIKLASGAASFAWIGEVNG